MRWLSRRRPATRMRIGRTLGRLSWWLVRRRRKVVMRNLGLCFPGLPERERRYLARQHFAALAQSIIDRSVLWYGSPEQIRELVTLSGFEHVTEGLARGPVILLAPHFIGLDAGATRLSLEGPAASMYQVQSDPGFDALFRRGRTRFNDIQLVSRREGIRSLLRHLQAGLPLYYLPDMDFGARGAVFVPFFGVPAATLTAPAQLASNWGAQILPVLTYWQPDTGRYHARVLPPLRDFPGKDDPAAAAARLNREIEAWVDASPSQYYWVHKRFKTRPPGEPDIYD
ncbi:acyltransferase [Verticiella sediminum]|uniref:Acyltransferase n=2 Tax=Verticiella sediminum TaxID=1247510 RepID=A0A556ACZ9_9BURK|nr:acyltransferase [Verticiella sediminum]